AESVLTEGDDAGAVTAIELALDGGDHLLKRLCEPICLVPADEAAGVDGDVEGVLELAKPRSRIPARTGRQRQQARIQVLVVERFLDQEIGERLRAQHRQPFVELAPRQCRRRFSDFSSLLQPGEPDRNAVLAEEAVAADRARAGAGECAAAKL